MKTKRKTNEQIVMGIMRYSRHGALSQLFVMDALYKFSKLVAESKPKDYGKNPFVHPEAWIGVAKEIRDALAVNDLKPTEAKKKGGRKS